MEGSSLGTGRRTGLGGREMESLGDRAPSCAAATVVEEDADACGCDGGKRNRNG